MKDITQSVNLFEIITKIIIPILSIISTLIIGIIIATALKRKEERSKIKQLLIDNYMDYLSARNIDIIDQINFATYEVINEILINPRLYITKTISDENFNIIKTKATQLKQKAEDVDYNNSHWSLFMYRFAFLLGKETYNNEALSLQKIIERNVLGENSMDNFITNTANKVASNKIILQSLNSNKEFEIEMAIYHIQRLVRDSYIDNQKIYVEPYNNAVADLIYKL